jgi:nucleoside-triphosphatase THEP1
LNRFIIITAGQGQGKTSLLKEVVSILKTTSIKLKGFYAEGYWENEKRLGFDLVDIATNEKVKLCSTKVMKDWKKIFHYYFNPEAIKIGNEILNINSSSGTDILIIDEIGKIDLRGEIWHDAVTNIVKNSEVPILFVVRNTFLKEVIEYWNLRDVKIFEVGVHNPKEVIDEIKNNQLKL